jgi:hypothetical protein
MRPECAVCGFGDSRGLTHVNLPSREVVHLCGTHGLVYARTGITARDASELRSLVRERRTRSERRRALADELVAKLADAFALEKRTGTDRRG